MPLDSRKAEALREFLASLGSVPWLDRAGTPSDRHRVVPDLVVGWDDWNERMLAVWTPETARLEEEAREAMGDAAIDEVFHLVAERAAASVLAGLDAYYERRQRASSGSGCGAEESLRHELVDAILRDAAWCAIERVLGRPAFFSHAMDVYRAGRWPCAWEGRYPARGFVVL